MKQNFPITTASSSYIENTHTQEFTINLELKKENPIEQKNNYKLRIKDYK